MNNDHVKKRLLEAHPANEFGTWRILGEDPNCDLGGHHHEPELETVSGTYANVVEYAITLQGFFQWGSGGRIVKIPSHHRNIDQIINNPKVKSLETERTKLQKRLNEIEKELQDIGK